MPRRDWIIGGLVVVALLAILAAVVVWRVGRDDGPSEVATEAPPPTTAPPTSGTEAPASWPIEIQPLVEFVEQHRGGPFDHPVPVDYLEEDEYRKAVSDTTEMDEEERSELEEWAAQMRSLGLLGEGVDLDAALDQLYGEGTLAFYDDEAEEIKVRGSKFDLARQVTLVHELTHAWQDQHGFIPDLEEMDDTEASTARAVIEGDANRIENLFVESLSSRERQQYQEQSREQAGRTDLEGVPGVLVSGLASAYALGEPFVAVLDLEGGNAEVDAALTDVPAADADLLDPVRFLDGVEPVEVPEPALPAGAERTDGGDFGAISWLMVLGERIDHGDALTVADSWAGDQYVAYRLDGRTCTAIAYRAEESGAAGTAADAMRQWADNSPGLGATVEVAGDDVVLRSCEPDPGQVPAPADRTELNLGYAALRVQIFAQALSEDFTVVESWCIGDHFARALTPEQMESGAAGDPSIGQRLANQAVDACT